MNNLILEMRKITEDGKDNNLPNIVIRTQLKEFLHYFVLDFIYNSKFKDLIFYGGSCARIMYNLDRMSEDLDFEADKSINFKELGEKLKKYFSEDLKLNDKFSIKKEKGINRIFLKLPVMRELELSPHESESLNIKVEIRAEDKEYFNDLKPVFTPKNMYGKSFVVKHYDLPTLFASKLCAILNRPRKGFSVGGVMEEINYKGRDFYDLIWYMQQRILPNEEILRANKTKNSIGEIFDEISVFIAKNDFQRGLKRDLEHLFPSQNFVENFVITFRDTFYRFKKERYTARKIGDLDSIVIDKDFSTDDYFIRINYLCFSTNNVISFLFKLTYEFIYYAKGDVEIVLAQDIADKINFDKMPMLVLAGEGNRKEGVTIIKKYVAVFLRKIEDYLARHNNEVYFDNWNSKLIRMYGENFNPEKEIVFHSGEELANNKKIKLEDLQM
ncbi:MAG: nucleotidyl transferase AbiEii/AbiGii toxin family protein [bacterium]